MSLEQSQIDQLADEVKGQVLVDGDEGFDEARALWNGMIDRKPAAILRCETADDVVAGVKFARDQGLKISVRGGGHNVAGRAVGIGALMLDLSGMRAVEVDADARRARVEPGALWGDVDTATQEHNLMTPGGTVSVTGVAGLTLGGGLGFLSSAYGLTADNLMRAELVTAQGERLTASEDENPDLLWALRGGGGGFGVVTRFEFKLHPVGPQVAVAQAYTLLERGREALQFLRDFQNSTPDDIGVYGLIIRIPPIEDFPAEHHGALAVAILAAHPGSVEEGSKVLAPLAEFEPAMLSFVAPMNYVDLQQSFDAGAPDGARYYFKSEYMDELSDEAIDALLGSLDDFPGEFTMVGFEPMGGAVQSVAADATAFPHRDSQFLCGVWGGWSDPGQDEEIIAWCRKVHGVVSEYSNGGTYANYLDRDDDERTRAAFKGNYERLMAMKREMDPTDLFGAEQFVTLGD